MSHLSIFYFSQALSFTYFWIALAVPYLLYRGLSSTEVFTLMSLYQIFGVILEYPTGLLGDKFGYRRMLFIANLFNGLSMFIFMIPGNYNLYLFGMFVLALGTGFSSGNDMGMLKSVAKNIKKDTANYHALADFTLFLAAIIGGWMTRFGYAIALSVSAIAMISANIPLYFLPIDPRPSRHTLSIFKIVRDGISLLRDNLIFQLFIIIAIFGGFSLTIKSILGSFGEIYQIDVLAISLYIGLGGLARAIGGKLYAHLPSKQAFYSLGLVTFFAFWIAILRSPTWIMNWILILQIGIGYILSMVDGDIQDLVSDHVRSSIFSLKRLIMRLVSSIFLALYGLGVDHGRYTIVMLGMVFAMLSAMLLSKKYIFANLNKQS